MRLTQANPLAMYVDVYLDGRQISHVLEADEEKHYVVVVVHDLSGKSILSQSGTALTKRLEGRVEVILRPGAPEGVTRDLVGRIAEDPKKKLSSSPPQAPACQHSAEGVCPVCGALQ